MCLFVNGRRGGATLPRLPGGSTRSNCSLVSCHAHALWCLPHKLDGNTVYSFAQGITRASAPWWICASIWSSIQIYFVSESLQKFAYIEAYIFQLHSLLASAGLVSFYQFLLAHCCSDIYTCTYMYRIHVYINVWYFRKTGRLYHTNNSYIHTYTSVSTRRSKPDRHKEEQEYTFRVTPSLNYMYMPIAMTFDDEISSKIYFLNTRAARHTVWALFLSIYV